METVEIRLGKKRIHGPLAQFSKHSELVDAKWQRWTREDREVPSHLRQKQNVLLIMEFQAGLISEKYTRRAAEFFEKERLRGDETPIDVLNILHVAQFFGAPRLIDACLVRLRDTTMDVKEIATIFDSMSNTMVGIEVRHLMEPVLHSKIQDVCDKHVDRLVAENELLRLFTLLPAAAAAASLQKWTRCIMSQPPYNDNVPLSPTPLIEPEDAVLALLAWGRTNLHTLHRNETEFFKMLNTIDYTRMSMLFLQTLPRRFVLFDRHLRNSPVLWNLFNKVDYFGTECIWRLAPSFWRNLYSYIVRHRAPVQQDAWFYARGCLWPTRVIVIPSMNEHGGGAWSYHVSFQVMPPVWHYQLEFKDTIVPVSIYTMTHVNSSIVIKIMETADMFKSAFTMFDTHFAKIIQNGVMLFVNLPSM